MLVEGNASYYRGAFGYYLTGLHDGRKKGKPTVRAPILFNGGTENHSVNRSRSATAAFKRPHHGAGTAWKNMVTLDERQKDGRASRDVLTFAVIVAVA